MNYSLRGFLRNAPNTLLQQFFADRGILQDFQWTKQDKKGETVPLSETEVEGIEEAIGTLQSNDRLRMEQEFKDIVRLANEDAVFCFIDVAKNKIEYKADLVAEFDKNNIKGVCERSFWVFLYHNELFKYVYKFIQVTKTSAARDFPVGKIKIRTDDKSRDLLKESVIKHYKGKGRGEKCIIDYYHRKQDIEQHCFYVFQEDCVKTVLDFTDDGKDVVRNPQRDIFENIFFYEPQTGMLQIHAAGERNTEELADLFCIHILGLEGRPNRDTEVYDLSKIKNKGFKFDLKGHMEKIHLKEVVCDMGNNEEITLKTKGRDGKGLLLLDRMKTMIEAYKNDACDVTILKIRFQVVFARQDGGGRKTRICEITYPNKIDLEIDTYGAAIKNCIENVWKFKRLLFHETDTIEAA